MSNETKNLEELARACPAKSFKAFIGKSSTQAILCADTGAEIVGWGGFDSSALEQQSQRKALAIYIAAADPKTVLALLAELEKSQQHSERLDEMLTESVQAMKAAEQRIAELGQTLELVREQRDNELLKNLELEAKLDTPVQLPDSVLVLLNHIEDVIDDENWNRISVEKWNAVTMLSEQGFKVKRDA